MTSAFHAFDPVPRETLVHRRPLLSAVLHVVNREKAEVLTFIMTEATSGEIAGIARC